MQFPTKNKDNDQHSVSCAKTYKGASWYIGCHSSNLNGLYVNGPHSSYADGVNWGAFRGVHYSLKNTAMKVKIKS